MESILVDVRRVWCSIRDLARARRDAYALSGRMRGGRAMDHYRSIGESVSKDVYGRENRIDIYSGREAFELHKKLSFNKMPPL